jgi:hypothetical protein
MPSLNLELMERFYMEAGREGCMAIYGHIKSANLHVYKKRGEAWDTKLIVNSTE